MRFHQYLRRSIFLGFVGIGVLFGAAAHAQDGMCGPTQDVYLALTDRFAESAIFRGLTESGSIIEIWGNPESGTWTALQTYPDGQSCIREDGIGYGVSGPTPTGAPA